MALSCQPLAVAKGRPANFFETLRAVTHAHFDHVGALELLLASGVCDVDTRVVLHKDEARYLLRGDANKDPDSHFANSGWKKWILGWTG
jgi:glyoxylase-like metal-dependent hydrolase (beta-lactamase superfamily II)